jgi:hypothetical protein
LGYFGAQLVDLAAVGVVKVFDALFTMDALTLVGLLLVSFHKASRTLKNGVERPFYRSPLEGERVGELSNVTSAHLLPLLEHTETIGETALAYAKIAGSALAAQLVLHAAKATEISNDWLSEGHTPPQSSSHRPRDTTSYPHTPHRRHSSQISHQNRDGGWVSRIWDCLNGGVWGPA